MWMYYLKLIGNALINCKLQHPPHCDSPPLSLQHLSFWGLVPSNFHLSLEQNWVQILSPSAGVASQKPYSEKKCLNREEKRHGVWPFIKTVTFHDTAVASHTGRVFGSVRANWFFFITSIKCRFQTSVKPEITIRIIATCFLSFFYGLDLSYYFF